MGPPPASGLLVPSPVGPVPGRMLEARWGQVNRPKTASGPPGIEGESSQRYDFSQKMPCRRVGLREVVLRSCPGSRRLQGPCVGNRSLGVPATLHSGHPTPRTLAVLSPIGLGDRASGVLQTDFGQESGRPQPGCLGVGGAGNGLGGVRAWPAPGVGRVGGAGCRWHGRGPRVGEKVARGPVGCAGRTVLSGLAIKTRPSVGHVWIFLVFFTYVWL